MSEQEPASEAGVVVPLPQCQPKEATVELYPPEAGAAAIVTVVEEALLRMCEEPRGVLALQGFLAGQVEFVLGRSGIRVQAAPGETPSGQPAATGLYL